MDNITYNKIDPFDFYKTLYKINDNIDLNFFMKYWIDYLKNRCLSLFVWEGLPFAPMEMEKPLLFDGKCFIRDQKRIPYYCTLTDFTGKYFDEPLGVNYISPKDTGYSKISDGILMKNTSTYQGLWGLIQRYALLLAHNNISYVNMLVNIRNPHGVPIVASNNDKDSMQSYLSDLYQGKQGVMEDPTFQSIEFKGSIGSIDNNLFKTFVDAENNLLAGFFNDIGIKSARTKNSNMVATEVEGSDMIRLINVEDMWQQRLKSAEEMKKRYGWENVSVHKNPNIFGEEVEDLRKYTLNDFFKFCLSENKPLLGSLSKISTDWGQVYESNFVELDRYFRLKMGEWFVTFSNYNNPISGEIEDWQLDVSALIRAQQYKLDTLWESTQQVYNPIQNYDKTIKEEITQQHQDTDTTGSQSITMEYGDQYMEDQVGNTTSNTVNSVAAANDGSEHFQDSSKNSFNGQTNSTTTDSHTDQQTAGERIDKNAGDYHITRNYSEVGNIGVQTAADMLMRQRELADYSFWDNLIEIIGKNTLKLR